ncbi:hypothetical protein [Streptomyces colonosanans]|uniref:Uncharacterized protein n=1 Tax=Streptomyces colonosanans TaxID=1428652 RepID=A0A1S2Q744_9ACTN|nr:hypothetical protein BIV24_00660 [Streptomyces colonosanans]
MVATRHWHSTRHHEQQADAARRAAEHLRAAYRVAAAQPIAVIHQRGLYLTVPQQHRQATALRQTLPPALAEQVLAEPGWPALAATLADAEAAGRDPVAVLTEAAARRELGTATSVSEVLVWRLHHLVDLPLQPAPGQPASAPPPARSARPTQQHRTR